MKDTSLLLDLIGNSMKSRVLDYLLTNAGFIITPQNIAKETKDSLLKIKEFLNFLVEQEVLIKEKKGYLLNSKNKISKALMRLDDVLILQDLKKRKNKIGGMK